MRLCAVLLLWVSVLVFSPAIGASGSLRILTWEGYVTPKDIERINVLLKRQDYPFTAQVVMPLAENAEQMFRVIREDRCDITFLTLFFIKMERQQLSRLLQPINIHSPRLTHYHQLRSDLTHIPMGMRDGRPLYIPWGAGIYGFYVNSLKLADSAVPLSVKALWQQEWAGKFSLTGAQEWYNVGLALMAMGYSPFYLDELITAGQRQQAIAMSRADGELQQRLTALYQNAGHMWGSTSQVKPGLTMISSWGPEITRLNQAGGRWRKVNFSEGDMVWLDTINFTRTLAGKKLEAAEIVANYFIGKEVQHRVVKELSMIAASRLVKANPTINVHPRFFDHKMFVPPYESPAHAMMQQLVRRARKAVP